VSATIVAKGLAAGHGPKALFADLDLVIAGGDVIGLVGPNGAGKTTLLRTLAGELAAEAGSVDVTPSSAVVGYLPQERDRRPGESLRDFLARRTGVAAAQAAFDLATAAFSSGEAGADDAYAEALDRWLALGAADLDERAGAVLDDLGLDVGLDADMGSLSGGQAARAGLASLLLSRYDALLLDEPTNDLDLDGLERLERFVTELRTPAVIVSHDREFLARTVNRVVELDLPQQRINVYGGGYDAYLREREVARQHAREDYEEYSGRVDDLTERARMQRSWSDRGVAKAKRKQGDEKDKHVRAHSKETSEKQASKARQTQRALERLDVVDEPRKEWELRMEIAAAPRSGAVSATLIDAVVRRGAFEFGPVTLEVSWGDRISITGPNGSGKSTLLDALLGRIPLDAGRGSLGPGVVVGEVDQARGLFASELPLIDAFAGHVPDLALADLRTLLAKFGLKAEHVGRGASTLSPGERTRAALALLQARGVNLLVLDEPTNHLDLAAIEQLEQALESYPGTLLLVTHDRRMLAAVRTNRRLTVAGGRVTES
jgi:ATPase subunit of ABC transporter with duplicated ATPase domains